jgi:FlaA1/EpsC-like NDP-sugar epimerase
VHVHHRQTPKQDSGDARAASREESVIIIGQPGTCMNVERMLDLLGAARPLTLGWIVVHDESAGPAGLEREAPILGCLGELESIIARSRPSLAIVSLPAVMAEQIRSIRTRLRRLAVPDRFMATIEDQLAGLGPRARMDIDLAELLNRPVRAIDEQTVRETIGGRRVLITGAGGSIGSELARIAARFDPSHLVLVERSENALFEIDRQVARFHPSLKRAALLHDVVDAEQTMRQFRAIRPQVIFHAAAHKHVPMMQDHPAAAIENNLFGTRSVADAAAAVDAERFVLISTDKAVNPTSVMGATKRLAELYIQHMQLSSSTGFSMVRFGNVLGSSGSVLDVWARQISEGGPLTVTDPRMTRYFMTIPEAASLVIQSAAMMNPGAPHATVFVLDMGEPVNILALARRYAGLHGLDPIVDADNSRTSPAGGSIRVVFTSVRPGEKLHEQLAVKPGDLLPTTHRGINTLILPPPDGRYVQMMFTRLASAVRKPLKGEELSRLVLELVPESLEAVA